MNRNKTIQEQLDWLDKYAAKLIRDMRQCMSVEEGEMIRNEIDWAREERERLVFLLPDEDES